MTKLKDIILLMSVLLLSTASAELLVRYLDDFPLFSVRLPDQPMQDRATIAGLNGARHYASDLKLADGMDAKWFDEDPPPLTGRQPDPALKEFISKLPAGELGVDAVKLWNSEYFRNNACSAPLFASFPHRAFLFDSIDGSEHPPYRFPYDVTMPSMLRTNQFGFRGAPISLDKPSKTIRIAFVGASTTVSEHNFPFSYPEFIGHWLNLWAKRKGLDVVFETINAGREGINSTDIAAIVRTELLPFGPDLVVYYEGSNQFSPAAIVPDYASSPPRHDFAAGNSLLDGIGQYSALARRVAALKGALTGNAGAEPRKPDYTVAWPKDIDEFDPPIEAPNLPSNLSTILRDLNSIRKDTESVGGEMVMSSFRWLARDGMTLDPIKHRSILQYLNVVFYPFHYREMERIAAFQNRVFEKWAKTQGLNFIDVARQLPFAPDLMEDAIHETYPGLRLRAWFTLQDLIPLVERRIDADRLRKPMAVAHAVHSAFPANPHTVAFTCEPVPVMTETPPIKVNNPQSAVEYRGDGTVMIKTAPVPGYYAADAYIPAGILSPGNIYELEIEARVMQGHAGAGVMTADDSHWLVSSALPEGRDFAKVDLPFKSDTEGHARVTFFNGNANASAAIEIRSLRVLSSGPAIQLLGPGLVVN